MLKLRIFTLILSLILMGCGAAPGGDSLDGANGDFGLPLSGATQNNNTSWSLFKDGSYSSSQQTFLQTLNTESASSAELADAHSGIGWSKVKLTGSASGIQSFRDALAKNSNQPEARVGLAGALISKGTKEEISEAVTVLEGIDPNNSNFTFFDRYNIGVSNAEAHALLAYAYFVKGDRTKANVQIKVASDLDAQFSGTTVDQIAEILQFIP
ncbi:MAG: hypothetical protein COB02_06500 [Candidatus Cloacimonadota bacterium]|nr:MAG: hypothetical protein COB02_06500 [Candidatus Cloacimonadota bacterium]